MGWSCSVTFLQLDLPAVGGPQPVLPLLLPGRRVLVLGRRPGDDARLLHPELVNLQHQQQLSVSTASASARWSPAPPCGGPHTYLSAALGADQPGYGAEVVVVGADEDPEERSLCAAPFHRLSLATQLHLHRGLTARVPLCQQQQDIHHTATHVHKETKQGPSGLLVALFPTF